MKKILAFLLCAGAVLSLAACAAKEDPAGGGSVQIANPFVEYDTLAEAAEAVGFELTVPDSVDGYGQRIIQVMSDTMLQVMYLDGDTRLLVRKAAGAEDISGDYNTYAKTETVRINGSDVTLRGDDGQVSVATWTRDGYTYAVDLDRPMAPDALAALIEQIL